MTDKRYIIKSMHDMSNPEEVIGDEMDIWNNDYITTITLNDEVVAVVPKQGFVIVVKEL